MTRSGYHRTAGNDELTERQREVLRLIAKGRTNGEIATELGISIDGVKWHVREILAKLAVDSREEAAASWRAEQGWTRRLTAMMAVPPFAAAGAAVAVAAVAVFGLLFVIATDDETGPDIENTRTPPSTAVTPTPGNPPATLTPDEADFREFALVVHEQLQDGNTSYLDDRVELGHVVCTEDHYPPSGVDAYPCESVGDEFWYFVTGETHGVRQRVDDPESFTPVSDMIIEEPGTRDGFGPGTPRVVAIERQEENGDGGTMTMLVSFIAASDVPAAAESTREVYALQWEQAEDTWGLTTITRELAPVQILADIAGDSPVEAQEGWRRLGIDFPRCETEARYRARPHTSGYEAGNVTVELPQDAEVIGVSLRETAHGDFALLLRLFVDADPGTPVSIEGVLAGSDDALRFTHPGGDVAEATEQAEFELGDGSPETEQPADAISVTGDLVTTDYGCHQVWVTADGERHGPFGVMAWPNGN